uniref:Ig-like domain-containing protein n=1 Tax=Electrophorus electricus TaxID=8005 RepID=A0A4W4DSZ4_ELEEL
MFIHACVHIIHVCCSCVVGVVQKDPLITAELGANLAILCNYSSDFMHKVSWYKQTIGTRQLLVADSQRYSKEATFYNGFDKNHYIVQTEDSSCALSIVKTEQSDSATYYCAVAFLNIITFGDGTVLVIKDSEGAHYSNHTLLQQPMLEPVHPGNSVTLQCTVLTEICVGGHSVYWFRHCSNESQPGIIYSNGHSKGQCQKSSVADSLTESFVYELTKRNLSLSDAGTYYCAVALCGEILFGNGTTLFFNGKDCNIMSGEKTNIQLLLLGMNMLSGLSILRSLILAVMLITLTVFHCFFKLNKKY